MLNDDTHAKHILNSKRVVLSRSALTVSAKCLIVPKLVYKFSIFPGAKIPIHLSVNVI